MKTTRATIAEVLAMLSYRCPGRDPLSEVSKGLDDEKKDANGDTKADQARRPLYLFWFDQLHDLDANTLLAATRDLCGAPGQWAPSVGDIRQRAVELSLGHLAPPSVGEAWGRVVEWAKGEPIQLTDAEKAAAKRAGGTWELKHSENVTTTRAHFIRFYEEEIRKLVMTRRAHLETRELADHNRPALPDMRINHPRLNQWGRVEEYEPTPPTPDELKKILSRFKGYKNGNERATDRDAGEVDPPASEEPSTIINGEASDFESSGAEQEAAQGASGGER